MEAKKLESHVCLGMDGVYVELKVRANEDDFDYYVFPKHIVEKTIFCLEKANISYDDVPADSELFQRLPAVESKYSVEEYDESDCVALNSKIDIDDLYEIIAYIEKHPQEQISIVLYKNSELPEFQNLLNNQSKELYSPEMQALLIEYMKILLDMSVSDRLGKIVEYMERGSFAKLLKLYSTNVIEYILSNVTKRLETELREEMVADV